MNGTADDSNSRKSGRSMSPYEDLLTPVVDSNFQSALLHEGRKASFRSVMFREKLREFDDKYVIQGRFGYELEVVPSSPGTRGQQRRNERIIPRVGPALEEDLDSYESSETAPDEGSIFPLCCVSLQSNAVIEPDDTVDGTSTDVSNPPQEDVMSQVMEDAETPISRKRKRDQEESSFHPVTPQLSDSSVVADDCKGEENISYPALNLFWRKSGTFLDEPHTFGSHFLDSGTFNHYDRHPALRQVNRTFMQVAQILVEQLILQTEPSSENSRFSEATNYQAPCRESNQDQIAVRDTVLRFFPRSEQCTLAQYVNAGRENSELPSTIFRQPQKEKGILSTPKGTGISRNSLTKLQAPYTCVRRNQTMMDLLAPALHFWEELGLGPAHECKDVTALYIFSASNNIQRGVQMFSKMMGNTYQGCKLGTHDEASGVSDYLGGLVPVSMHGDYSVGGIDEALQKSCEKLGRRVSVAYDLLQLIQYRHGSCTTKSSRKEHRHLHDQPL